MLDGRGSDNHYLHDSFEQSGPTPRLQEQFGYAYDNAGNLNGRTNNALIQSIAVNNLNELSSASHSGTLTVAGTTTEPGSDVTSVSVNGTAATEYADGSFAASGFAPSPGQNTYTAIAQDNYNPPRLSTNSVTVNVLGGSDYTYDSNGNLLGDGTRNFAYNDENQLVGVWAANSWSNSFAYDGLMRKRIEQNFAWNGSGWTETNEVHYIYDGNLVLQERDGNNNPLTTYTRGIDLSGTLDGAGGIGGLLARSDNQKIVPAILTPTDPTPQNLVTSYYFNDAQGNVTALVSPAGMILAQYEYDPFGNLVSKSGLMADINKYRFSSKEWDDNAGLYYYGFRFYDPNLQRWVNQDPIGERGGMNLYDYVMNNPINYLDPLGLCDCSAQQAAVDAAKTTVNRDLQQVRRDARNLNYSLDGVAVAAATAAGGIDSLTTGPEATPVAGVAAVSGVLGVGLGAAIAYGSYNDENEDIQNTRDDFNSYVAALQALKDCQSKTR